MATPKIWLMGPDPSKQCCACGSKTGPCDTCFACNGERYNVAFHKWYLDTSYLSGVIPADCNVAQSTADSNSISDKTISLTIGKTGPNRSNAYTNRYPNGSGINGAFTMATTTTVTPFAATYGSPPDIGGGIRLYYPLLDTGHQLVLYGTTTRGTKWATGLSWDFAKVSVSPSDAPLMAPTQLNDAGMFFVSPAPGVLPYTPFPTHIYPLDYNGGTGLQPWAVGSYIPGLGHNTDFTPYAVGGVQAQRVVGSVYNVPNSATGATGVFFPDVSAQETVFSADVGPRTWICTNDGGQFSWAASSGAFNNLNLLPAATSAYESMIASYVGSPPLTGNPTDGNRTLGYRVQLVGPPGYENDPSSAGICCGFPPFCSLNNIGQSVTYDGSLDFQLFISASWPFQGFNASLTNYLAIRTTSGVDSCITALISGGGTGFDGIKTTTRNVAFSYSQDQSLAIAPLIYITGANVNNVGGAQEACPFSLP